MYKLEACRGRSLSLSCGGRIDIYVCFFFSRGTGLVAYIYIFVEFARQTSGEAQEEQAKTKITDRQTHTHTHIYIYIHICTYLLAPEKKQ